MSDITRSTTDPSDATQEMGDRATVADGRPALHTDDLRGRLADPAPAPADAPSATTAAPMGSASSAAPGEQREPLFRDAAEYRERWDVVQTGFVDEPHRAVERADALVAEVIQELVSSFADERGRLESQWAQGDEASTEDLRLALRRYRSFFDRLLTA